MKASVEKPWLKYYKNGASEVGIPDKTIYRYLVDRCKGYENYVALDYFNNTTTYGELFQKIDQIANAFTALGVKPGEHVVFVTVNMPETIYSFYALNKIGAIPVIIEPRMPRERIWNFIRMVKAKTVLVVDAAFFKVKNRIKKLGLRHVIVQHPEDSLLTFARIITKIFYEPIKIDYDSKVISFNTFQNMIANTPATEAPYKKDSVCVVTQTGGTTGIPKGVMLKNSSLNSIALGFEYANIDVVPGNKFLNIMPIFTSYGVVCGIHMALTQRVVNILVPNFTPQKFPKLIAKHKPHSVIGVPSFYESLLKSKIMKKVNLSDLCFAVTGGDLMNPSLEESLNEFLHEHRCRYNICQGYGLSEASAVICFSHVYREHSEGIPLCTSTMGIFNPETDEELDYNEVGEICVCGPSVMKGYFGNEKETKQVLKVHNDGSTWLHTGDLGHFDKDGFLYFDGRIKYVIPRFDGHKNFPIQIETVVNKHMRVKNCVVIGVKDLDHSQGMWPLVIVEANPEDDKDKLKKEILELCKKHLEERGQPIGVVFEDKIPLTLIGKNDVATLSKKYLNYNYKKNVLK